LTVLPAPSKIPNVFIKFEIGDNPEFIHSPLLPGLAYAKGERRTLENYNEAAKECLSFARDWLKLYMSTVDCFASYDRSGVAIAECIAKRRQQLLDEGKEGMIREPSKQQCHIRC
jgi:hypothetical protein